MKLSIKALRVNAKLLQKQVAESVGVNVATIISWESEKTFPTATQLNKLCSLYGCSMDDVSVPDKLA